MWMLDKASYDLVSFLYALSKENALMILGIHGIVLLYSIIIACIPQFSVNVRTFAGFTLFCSYALFIIFAYGVINNVMGLENIVPYSIFPDYSVCDQAEVKAANCMYVCLSFIILCFLIEFARRQMYLTNDKTKSLCISGSILVILSEALLANIYYYFFLFVMK